MMKIKKKINDMIMPKIIDEVCCQKEDMPAIENLLLRDACNRYLQAITLEEQEKARNDIAKLLGRGDK